MSFEALQKRAAAIGEKAALALREDILRSEYVPKDVQLQNAAQGITLSGRGLRRRFIDDPALRNLVRGETR